MPQLNTLFFDFDRTLRFSKTNWEDYAADYLDSIGYSSTRENRRNSKRWTYQYFCSEEFTADRSAGSSEKEFWELFNRKFVEHLLEDKKIAKNLTPDLIRLLNEEYFTQDLDFVPEDGISTLEILKKDGYKLGIITNRQTSISGELDKLALTKFFPHVIVSGQVGVQKPDPAIFQHAISIADCAVENCVYVGDNYFADVIGARNAGIQPILIDPDSFFPEADCPVIQKLSDLLPLLDSVLN